MPSSHEKRSGAQLGHKRDIPAFDTVLFHSNNLRSLTQKCLSDILTDKIEYRGVGQKYQKGLYLKVTGGLKINK